MTLTSPVLAARLCLFFSLIGTCLSQTPTTEEFVDPLTGATFQRFFGARTGFGFAMALPENGGDSFIGQLSFPLNNGAGYGGFSLTSEMEGPLQMAAWADGGQVISSFRQSFDEDQNPPEVTGSFSARPIAQFTSANSTQLVYTFLCEGCLNSAFGLSGDVGTAEMGWALGSGSVGGSSDSELDFHNVGFGEFNAQLGQARTAQFNELAALAGSPLSAAGGAIQFSTQFLQSEGEDDDGEDDDDD